MSNETTASGYDQDQFTNKVKDGSLGFVGDVLMFTGEVHFKSMLRIDGRFSGQINSSDGTLIITSGAQITDVVINVAVAKINGTVKGDINASKELVLGRLANVTGKLSTATLIIEDGALFNGSCSNRI